MKARTLGLQYLILETKWTKQNESEQGDDVQAYTDYIILKSKQSLMTDITMSALHKSSSRE